jgi:prepilin-type N-terminal cleavage/methylation domain-containing protein
MIFRNQRAFTLIELLIVVAIIAILAAIAVPNFLEAQTRSKVTRTISDMRSTALAMEMYFVDNNQIPMAAHPTTYVCPPPNCPPLSYANDTLRVEGDTNFHAGNWLSSPIEYISEVPFDEFNSYQDNPTSGPFWGGARISYIYWGDPVGGEDGIYPWFSKKSRWVLTSVGPNLFFDSGLAGDPFAQHYDPTNGTVSDGLILRWDGGRANPEY